MSGRPVAWFAPPPEDPAVGVSASAAEPALEWEHHPWREHSRATLAGSVLITALLVLIAAFPDAVGVPPLALAVLLLMAGGSLGPAWWPSRFRVDGSGVAARQPFVWRKMPWSEVRRATIVPGRPGGWLGLGRVPEALFVSPLPRPGRLDAFRGMHLDLPSGAGRDALVVALRHRLSSHGL
jgi:hypothetical protein